MTFLLGILSSLVAGVLFVLASAFFSQRTRGILVSLLARLLKLDSEAVFLNKQDASKDIDKELLRASDIKILTGRGNELQRGILAQFLGGPRPTRLRILRIALPLVDFQASKENPDWLSLRETELAAFDHVYNSDLLRNQVRANIRYLEAPVREGRAEVRLFNSPHLGRIIVTDAVAYLNRYAATAHGRDCEIVKFRKGGPMYEYCERAFDLIWSQAIEPYRSTKERRPEAPLQTSS